MAKEIPEGAVEMYVFGKSTLEVARHFGVGVQRVQALMRERGVLRTPAEGRSAGWTKRAPEDKIMPCRKGKDLPEAEVLNLRQKGMSPSQIGHLLGIGARRVHDFLSERGLVVPRQIGPASCVGCGIEMAGTHGANKLCLICAPDGRHQKIFWKYGLTKPAVDRMVRQQGGCCALCSKEPMVVDHCHRTGKVRGLLCNWCNTTLGRIDEDHGWAERALAYVARVPPQEETPGDSP